MAVQRSRSRKLALVNQNVAGLGLFWSLSSESFKSLDESNPDQDLKTVVRSCLLIGGLGLLSLLGLIFLLIITLSMHFFVKSRKSEKVFSCDLAKTSGLDLEMARDLVYTNLN